MLARQSKEGVKVSPILVAALAPEATATNAVVAASAASENKRTTLPPRRIEPTLLTPAISVNARLTNGFPDLSTWISSQSTLLLYLLPSIPMVPSLPGDVTPNTVLPQGITAPSAAGSVAPHPRARGGRGALADRPGSGSPAGGGRCPLTSISSQPQPETGNDPSACSDQESDPRYRLDRVHHRRGPADWLRRASPLDLSRLAVLREDGGGQRAGRRVHRHRDPGLLLRTTADRLVGPCAPPAPAERPAPAAD